MGRGGWDASRDVLKAAMGTIHFGSVTSDQKISIIPAILKTPVVTQLPALSRTQGILLTAMCGRPSLACNIVMIREDCHELCDELSQCEMEFLLSYKAN